MNEQGLLPSLHALVEKWRSEAVSARARRVHADGIIERCANELEALLSRAATTQAGTRQFFEDDEGDIYELIGSNGKGDYFMRRFANDDRDWIGAEQFGKMTPLYPSQPVAPVVPDGEASVTCQECGAEFYIVAGAKCVVCPACDRTIFLVAAPHPAQPQEREPRAEEWRQAIKESFQTGGRQDWVDWIEARARELARK